MAVKHKGIEMDLGGEKLIVPALNLTALEMLGDKLENFNEATALQRIGTAVDVTLAALNRNYPDMTRAQVADFIDLGNMADVMAAVMGISGLVATTGEMSGEATGKASQ